MEKRSTVIEESSRDKTLLNNWPLCLWVSRRETKDAVTSVVRPGQEPEVGSCQSNLVPPTADCSRGSQPGQSPHQINGLTSRLYPVLGYTGKEEIRTFYIIMYHSLQQHFVIFLSQD